MSKYKVLSPLKSGGKVREIGDEIELDDAVAENLRPGIVEAITESRNPPPAGKPATGALSALDSASRGGT